MGKRRLEEIKRTQPKNLGCLNPTNWRKPKHDKGTIKNRNFRGEKLRRKHKL